MYKNIFNSNVNFKDNITQKKNFPNRTREPIHVSTQVHSTRDSRTQKHTLSEAVDRSSNTSETVIPPFLPVQ